MTERKKTEENTAKPMRFNRRMGENRKVHNFRLNMAASEKLRALAAKKQTSQGAIIENLILRAR